MQNKVISFLSMENKMIKPETAMVEIQIYLLYFEEGLRGFHYSIICQHHNEVFAEKKKVNLKKKKTNKTKYNCTILQRQHITEEEIPFMKKQ